MSMLHRAAMRKRVLILLCWVLVAPEPASNQTKGVAINNTATYAGDGRYDWTVYIDADDRMIARIQSVEYTLDPSFPNPVRTVTTRNNKFALSANGWGEFTIYVRVQFTNGTTENHKYRLNLMNARRGESTSIPQKDAPAPRRTVTVESVPLATGNTSRSLGNGRWEWSVFLRAPNDVLNEIQYVEYTLHPTFREPVQRVTQRGMDSEKGFALRATGWGTFEIAVKVVFTNGKTRYLKHQLKFG